LTLLDFKIPRFHIMVSSTVSGLKRERKAIKDALHNISSHFHVSLSEDWGSDGSSPYDVCLKLARDCHYFILLLGKQYGYPPDGQAISVTEMEFEAARKADPEKVRAYVKKLRSVDSAQEIFIKRVRDFYSGLLCPTFSTLGELKKLVIQDVFNYTYYVRYLSLGLSQDYTNILPSGPKLERAQEQIFLPQSDHPHIEGSRIFSLIEQQRAYLRNSIHKKTAAKLAKRMMADLSRDDLFTLALIAQGYILTRKEYLKSLFPEIRWRGFIQRMRHRGLIAWENGHIEVADNVKKELEKDEGLIQESHKTWVSVLALKAGYTDLALALCLHLIALKQWSAAVEHAHSMMLAVEDRFTAKLFYEMLTKLRTSLVYHKISAHDRILLLNAIGVFRIREGYYKEAIKTFNIMLNISRRAKNIWGIGQALLHRGVAWAHFGDDRRAQHNYQQAADLARKEKDEFLLGRILHNLSQCQMANDSQLAAKTLEESIIHKKRSGDEEGLFAAYTGLGILAGKEKDHKVALHWFRRAERVARKFENNYELAHALHNQAISLSQQGRSQSAINLSRQAREIADSFERKDLIILTLQGEVVHRYEAQDYNGALPLSLKLHILKKETGDFNGAIIAMSDAGIMEMYLKHYDAARSHMRRATSLAKSMDSRHWLMQCINNHVAIWQAQGKPQEAIRLLKREIRWAERAEEQGIVADLAGILAQFLISHDRPTKAIDQAWEQAIAAADKQENIFKQVELQRQRYAWIRDSRKLEAAIAILQPFLELTERRKGLRRDYVEGLDEMGTCLQKLGRYDKAEQYYRKGLNLSKKDLDGVIPETLLNNYAELLRKIDRGLEAIPLYEQAVAICQSYTDLDGQLLTEHNLALALDGVGRTDEAVKLLIRIREVTHKKGFWAHHVNAWLALGNIAWLQNRRNLALRRYAKVRALCDRYQLPDFALNATLNEASLLQEMGRGDTALSLLQPLHDTFKQNEHCPELYLTLGRCYIARESYKEAIDVLEDGLRCSQAQYSNDRIASLQTALAEANLKARRTRKARLQIEHALAADQSPEVRAEQLTDLLVIVATSEATKSGKGRQTERLLDEIQNFANYNKQPVWIRDAYERLGEALWDKDQKTAIQAYMAEMIKTLEIEGFEGLLRAGVDLVSRLHRLGLAEGEKPVMRLKRQARAWLMKQMKGDSFQEEEQKRSDLLHWLLWPFLLTLSLLHRLDKGRQIKSKEIERLLQEFLFRSMEPNRESK